MYTDETADPSVEKSFNKCIIHYRLPRDIQGHANDIERMTGRVATELGRDKRGWGTEVGDQWG